VSSRTGWTFAAEWGKEAIKIAGYSRDRGSSLAQENLFHAGREILPPDLDAFTTRIYGKFTKAEIISMDRWKMKNFVKGAN